MVGGAQWRSPSDLTKEDAMLPKTNDDEREAHLRGALRMQRLRLVKQNDGFYIYDQTGRLLSPRTGLNLENVAKFAGVKLPDA
jgi:hypothetical protein